MPAQEINPYKTTTLDVKALFSYICKMRQPICIIVAFLVLSALPSAGESPASPIGQRALERLTDVDGIIQESQVWDIECASDRVFFATNDGLFTYDGSRVRRFLAREVISLRGLRFDSTSGRLYSAGNNGFGWWEEDTSGRMTYHSVESDKYDLLNQDFWRVCQRRSGGICFQSSSRLCIFNPADESIKEILPHSHFRYMYDPDGEVYIQDGDMLCRLTQADSLETICTAEDRIMDILSFGGRMVAALERTGLMALEGNSLRPLDAESNNILSAAKILSLAECDSTHMIVGTTQGGYFITDSNGRICKTLNFFEPVEASVLSVSRDFNGDIWLGMEAGIARIDNSSRDYYLRDPHLGRVRGIVPLEGGALLAGSNKGAFIYNKDEFIPVQGTTGSVWNVFRFDEIAYIAHDQGLLMFDGKQGTIPLFTRYGVLSMVRSNKNRDLFICGTYNGLALFTNKDGRPKFVTQIGNYNGFCRNMHLDREDRLWIRDGHKGFIRLTLNGDYSKVIERKDFDLVRNEDDRVFSLETCDILIFCCNREAYTIDDRGDLARSDAGDKVLAEFEYNYGSDYRYGTEPYSLPDGCRAFGMLNGIHLCYGHRDIEESLRISQVELLGARKRASVPFGSQRIRIPHDMNTVQVYLSGNFNGKFVEFSTDSGKWSSVRADSPVQISALLFGNHDIAFRLPYEPEVSCSLKLHICRPWYLTGWAAAAYLLMILGLAAGIREYYKRQARQESERARLKADLKAKSKELANITFNSARRNNQLNEIKGMLTSVDTIRRPSEVARASRETVSLIDSYLNDNSDWERSEEYFNIIYDGLLDKLKKSYPGISKTDMKICIYTKLNLSTKEMADIMNISARSVEMARYRLRKRLGLPAGQDINDLLKSF